MAGNGRTLPSLRVVLLWSCVLSLPLGASGGIAAAVYHFLAGAEDGVPLSIASTSPDASMQGDSRVRGMAERLDELTAWLTEIETRTGRATRVDLMPDRQVAIEPGSARRELAPSASGVPSGERGSLGALDPERRRVRARELLNSPSQADQLQALRVLAEDSPAEARALIERVAGGESDHDVKSEWQALQAFHLLNERDELVAGDFYRWFSDGPMRLRREAARALERGGDARPMRELLEELSPNLASEDAGERARALARIAALRSRTSTEAVLPSLEDVDSNVRLQALEAIARSGDPRLVSRVEALYSDPVAVVRDRAARAAERLLGARLN